MADISKITILDGTTYNIKDAAVPSWAKASTKPKYTATEVGALADTTFIPTKTSDLINDSGFLTSGNFVTGVKGNAESSYRTGNINLTPANIGAPATDGTGASGTWGISISGNAATATKATQDGSGNTITSKYVTVDTDQLSITGQKRFTKAVQCYRYTTNNNLPAITMDKPGSYYIGIGADGTTDRIHFGPCTGLDGSAWVGTDTFNSNEWYFQGNITCTNNIKTASGCRIGESGGSLYLGNSGNQSWVYVQDMCSQDSSKWKLHTNGNAEFSGTVTASNFSGQTNGYTWALNTENTGDTWVPVLNGSTMQHRVLQAWLNNMSTVPVGHGGTGATSASAARTNLAVPGTEKGSTDKQMTLITGLPGSDNKTYALILYKAGQTNKISLYCGTDKTIVWSLSS